jgi:hypothetical protein
MRHSKSFIRHHKLHVGPNAVVLTVTDNNGNTSTCGATVTVEDNVAPVAICQAVTVQLDAAGNGGTTAAAVNNGSNDACGIASLSLDITSFTCANVGPNAVVLTVTDNNGNTSTCGATVTVEDNVAPVAICQAVTVQLDAAGNGGTTAAAVNNGSNDACGIASLSLDITSFTCANVGPNAVVLTVTDNNGNTSTCGATVTVEDNVAPVAICQAVTVQLDAAGNGGTTAAAVNNGSNDACGIASLSLDITSFTCANVGPNAVVLTVTDNNGNTSTCGATVTVEDNVAPVAICKPAMVTLSGGAASITPADVDDNSSDACGIASLDVSPNTFNCDNIGANTVVLTVTDNNGNVSTCSAVVTVVGTIPSATISQSTLPQFCQGNQIILTATPSEPVTYAWETGQNTQSIDVYATGTYNLNVTNANGCIGTASTYVNYNGVAFNAAYTIVGFEEVHLHGYNQVLNGGVGVTTLGETAKIHEYTTITAASTFVKAPKIDVKSGSVVTTQILGVANYVVPQFLGNPYAGTVNVNVANGTTVTLSDSIYKNVHIGENATVTFTRPVVYIADLKVKNGATVKFTGCTRLSVDKKVDFEKNTKFNLERHKVIMYVGQEDKKDNKKVVEWDEGSVFFGNVFAQRGEIRSHKGKIDNPIRLTGQFIARKVQGDDYTIWDWETNCDPTCIPAPAPSCACVGGIKKITFEYSYWDSSSVENNATMYISQIRC